MNRLRAVIADDEPLARARLARLLRDDGRIDVVAECASGGETVAALRRLRPDVAFLDIEMPDADAFRVLARQPRPRDLRIVFVTAYAGHALRAFDAQATDYLLKPLSPARLRTAVERLCAHADDDRTATRYAARLAVPSGARLRVLEVARIDCLLARANYVEVHHGGECALVRGTLSGLEARLDPRQFVRVHRSRIVRIDAVRDVELLGSGDLVLRLDGGLRVTTGRAYRQRVREVLGLAPARPLPAA